MIAAIILYLVVGLLVAGIFEGFIYSVDDGSNVGDLAGLGLIVFVWPLLVGYFLIAFVGTLVRGIRAAVTEFRRLRRVQKRARDEGAA